MKPILNQRHGVHRPDEQGREHDPMIERRAVHMLGNPAGEQEGHRDLNERLHGTIVA
jgi:hypothetical protein